MPEAREPRPPFACRWLIRLASWIVPRRERSEWCSRWYSGVRDWWILVERGELSRDASFQFYRHCRRAFADAFWRRFSREGFRRWLKSASFPLAVAASVLLVTAAMSRGLSETRSLIRLVLSFRTEPPSGSREEVLIAYALPVVFALFSAAVLVGAGRMSIYRQGTRYWAFFVLKTVSVMLTVTTVWIEGGAAIRGVIPQPIPRALFGGLILAIVFVAVFAYALLWNFDDQRRRCPVCLRRLAMPVSMGSWASTLEPVTTELLCDDGHGSLSVPESDLGESDRWTSLDASWRELFAVHEPGEQKR